MKTSQPVSKSSLILQASVLVAVAYLILSTIGLAIITSLSVEESTTASIDTLLSLALGVAAPVIAAIAVYHWFRKRHLSTHSEVSTTLAVTIGFAVAEIVSYAFIKPSLFDLAPLSADGLFSAVLLSTAITFLVALIGSHIGKRLYNHRHSVVVD